MRHHSALCAAAIATLVLMAACNGELTESPGNGWVPELGKGTVDMTTQANFVFADSVNIGTAQAPAWEVAGIQGDARLKDGTPAVGTPSNEYQGSFCGVSAVIGSGQKNQNADFVVDPNINWTSSLPASCQPARAYRIYLSGPGAAPSSVSPHTVFRGISTMAIGETRIQAVQLGTAGDLGIGLWFDDAYPPASSLLFMRLPNVTDASGRSVRQWLIQTRGTHRAMGVVPDPGGKGLVPSGVTYYLPFAMTLTEVPYPYPTYP
ncbi:MAG TPA: hypothetical protein VEU27_12260 [Gemmatimonadales bacterium]|nr:hypothetical protein [Gemmatimonadales bacterium]